MTAATIATDAFADALRRRAIDLATRQVLITQFAGTEQAKDLSSGSNCRGLGRIHHFHRFQASDWPLNPLPLDPAAHALGLPYSDSMGAQVFQNAACSWRCWYCFVDYNLLSAKPAHSSFKSVDELLNLVLEERPCPRIIDLSGGQPDLVPEWTLWFSDLLRSRDLESRFYLWSDDNLSNDFLWRFLTDKEVARLAASPTYGRVGCFKGFDAESFYFNTMAAPELFDRQFNVMRRLVDTGLDVYGYVTLTTPSTHDLAHKISCFVDRLQSQIGHFFPLRVVPLLVREYTPTVRRLTAPRQAALCHQHFAVEAWNEEINRRYSFKERTQRINEVDIGHRTR